MKTAFTYNKKKVGLYNMEEADRIIGTNNH